MLLVAQSHSFAAGTAADAYLPLITEEMKRYSHLRYAIHFAWVFIECAILFVFLHSGLSAKLRDWAGLHSKRSVVQLCIYYSIFSLYLFVTSFPLAFYSGFVLEHQFNLTDQSFLDWLAETCKKALVALAIVFPIKWCFFWLVRTQPKRWPWFLWAASSAYLLFQCFIAPLVFEPLFNRFTPLSEGSLKQQIVSLAGKSGIADAPILVADKSKQTKKFNAYVSGIGSSTHIVMWDTTIQGLKEDEIMAIVGHEMGHYVLKHELIDCALLVLLNLLAVPVNLYLAEPFVSRLPRRWGIQSLGDYAVVPVLSMVIIVGSFLGEPLINYWSRNCEHEADAYSLRSLGNGPAMASAFVKLSQQNLSEPEPPAFIKFWMFSHPSLKERIEFSLSKSN